MLLAALLSWLALSATRYRRLVVIFGTVLIAYGCTVGVASSIYGYYDSLRTGYPSIYWAIDRFTSPLPTLVTMIEGHPVVVRVVPPAAAMGNSGTYRVGSEPVELSNVTAEIDVVSPRAGVWELSPTISRMPGLAPGPVSVVVHYSNGGTAEFPVRASGPMGLRLSLHRGLNRIGLQAITAGTTGGKALVLVNGFKFAHG